MSEGQGQEEWIVVGRPKRKKIKKQDQSESYKGKIVWQMGKPLYSEQNHEHDLQSFISNASFSFNKQLIRSKLAGQIGNRKNYQLHIQCLGLGDFIRYAKPRFQYLFLVELLIPLCRDYGNLTVNCYDPVFTPQCTQMVAKLGDCIPNNIPKQGESRLIVLYMPHCERFLYERYCQKYKESRTLVIGNSIKDYINRCQLTSDTIPESFQVRVINQQRLKDFRQCFNDTYCYFI